MIPALVRSYGFRDRGHESCDSTLPFQGLRLSSVAGERANSPSRCSRLPPSINRALK